MVKQRRNYLQQGREFIKKMYKRINDLLSKDGTALAIQFAYKVNEKEYCGPKCSYNNFQEYTLAKNPRLQQEVREELGKFESLGPYLKTIAKKSGKDFLDYDVVEAYWIGNDLLDTFSTRDIKSIIPKLVHKGYLASQGLALMKNLPDGYVPHHNFHVMYMEGGNTYGKIPTTLNFLEKCRVSWGTITEVLDDKIIVNTNELIRQEKGITLIDRKDKEIKYDSLFIKPKENDIVAIHHEYATTVLSKNQAKNLEKYTHLILDIRNKDGFKFIK